MSPYFLFNLALWGAAGISSVHSTFVTPNLPLSFLFDWNDPTQPFPVPVTEQCETIHIKWSRSGTTGPNPTAPYYLQVYTSNFIQPFIIPAGSELTFDWSVPFAPGTLYQICMFDKFGNTGGCQDKYTIIAPSTPATCTNVTFAPQLGVSAIVDNGPMSQFGFIDQCTDISVTPTDGTPPFTLTVAPSLHPPFNITSFDMQPINWTVSLSWASPFFISLADSKGALWSNGPLHAGSGASSACLAGNVTSSRSVKVPVAVGVSFGALFLGASLAGIGLYILSQRRSHTFEKLRGSDPVSQWSVKDSDVAKDIPGQPQVNPFRMSGVGFVAGRPEFLRGKLQIPPQTVARDTVAGFERPPSYPQYSPSESNYLSRNAGLSPSSSPLASSSGGGISEKSLSLVQESERHYNPQGPLRLGRPRPRYFTDIG